MIITVDLLRVSRGVQRLDIVQVKLCLDESCGEIRFVSFNAFFGIIDLCV